MNKQNKFVHWEEWGWLGYSYLPSFKELTIKIFELSVSARFDSLFSRGVMIFPFISISWPKHNDIFPEVAIWYGWLNFAQTIYFRRAV